VFHPDVGSAQVLPEDTHPRPRVLSLLPGHPRLALPEAIVAVALEADLEVEEVDLAAAEAADAEDNRINNY
jgi:hypothetical protein